jgi:hypothetical protein
MVTRLAEFWPIGKLFTLGSFLKMYYQSSPNYWLHTFRTVEVWNVWCTYACRAIKTAQTIIVLASADMARRAHFMLSKKILCSERPM